MKIVNDKTDAGKAFDWERASYYSIYTKNMFLYNS